MSIGRVVLIVFGLSLFGCMDSAVERSKYWGHSMGVEVFAYVDGSCASSDNFTGKRTVWYKSRRSGFEIVISNEKIKDGLRSGFVREKVGDFVYLSSYLNGKRDGEFFVFGEKNNLLTRAFFRNGILSGTLSDWYSDGVLKKKAVLVDGILDGKVYTWWPNGTLSTIENYTKGIRNGEQWSWDEEGRVVSKEIIGADSVVVRKWIYNDGKTKVVKEKRKKACESYASTLHAPMLLKRVRCDNFWKIETIDYFSFLAPPCWESNSACECPQILSSSPREMFRIENP